VPLPAGSAREGRRAQGGRREREGRRRGREGVRERRRWGEREERAICG
jgi:hypothetical protein